MYCYRCGGANRSTVSVCESCTATILPKEEYEYKKNRLEVVSIRKKRLVVVETIIIDVLILFLGNYMDLFHIIAMVVVLGLPLLILLSMIYVEKKHEKINKKMLAELREITYLIVTPSSETEFPSEREEKSEEIKTEGESDRTSKIVSTMRVANEKAEPKVKYSQSIYKYSVKHLETHWKCVYCDVENMMDKDNCCVCGMHK